MYRMAHEIESKYLNYKIKQMTNKIFDSLKQNYANLGLGDEILQGHANALSGIGGINDENFETVIKSQGEVLSAIQKKFDSANSKATEYKNKVAELEGKLTLTTTSTQATQTQQTIAAKKKEDEMPAWAKVVLDELKSVKTENEAQRKEKAKNDLLASTTAFFANAKHLNKANLDTAMEFCYMTVNESSTEEDLRSAVIAKYDELQSRHGGLDKYVAIPASGGGVTKKDKWKAEAEKRKAQANEN